MLFSVAYGIKKLGFLWEVRGANRSDTEKPSEWNRRMGILLFMRQGAFPAFLAHHDRLPATHSSHPQWKYLPSVRPGEREFRIGNARKCIGAGFLCPAVDCVAPYLAQAQTSHIRDRRTAL